jgi:DHA2 family multidrug resistance protein-like MFS transporter
MTTPTADAAMSRTHSAGNDRLLCGMIFGALAFWLFAQTTLNISPTMAADLATQAANFGWTLSNLLLNAAAGILLVAMTLAQIGGGMTAQGAGLLTLGYAIAIVAFIRVGEKLLQRFATQRA